MNSCLHVLLVEDSADDAAMMARALEEAGFDVRAERVETATALRAALVRRAWSVVLADYSLPQFSGLEALKIIREDAPDLPVILVSGTVGEEIAVEAVKAGANDYVMKTKLVRLAPAVERELRQAAESRRRRVLESQVQEEAARFRALTEKSWDGIIVVDATGRLVYGSPSTERLMGYRPEEMLGQNLFEFVHDEDRAEAAAAFAETIATAGGTLARTLRAVRRGGAVRWLELTATNLLDVPSVAGVVVNYRDVTERRLAETALRESEARYRLLFEGAAEGILVADIGTRMFTYANPTICRMFGYTSEELCRLGLQDIHPAADLPRVQAEFEAQARGDKVVAYALPCRRRDGSVFRADIKTTATVLGGRSCNVGFFTDVSDRIQAEEALTMERGLLSALMENIPDSIYFKDRESRFILLNPALARHLGVSDPAAAIGRTDFNFFAEEHARQAYEDEQSIIRTGEPILEKEEKEIWPDGRIAWAATTKMPLRDATGAIIGTFGISRDITAQKLASERIREQAELLDQANDAIILRDLEHRIRYWNRSAERLFGWSATEALGCAAPELLHANWKVHEAALRGLLAKGDWTQEMQYLTKADQKLIVLSRWSLLRDEAGQPRAILTINTDITERKQLEARFLRAQRHESLGALASGIAHDLNNALAPIILGTALVRDTVQDPAAKGLLSMMEANAQRGADIVRQVLAFARGTGGERTTLQLRYVAAEMAKIAEATFPKNIRVATDLPADLWPIEGDPTQLHQAVMNLCVNARDAMPEGGTLTLTLTNMMVEEARTAQLPEAKPGPHVRVRVADTGTGIPPEIRERIFEPFFTTKGLGKGTGLGLSTVLGILHGHGGFLDVQSEVGRGTTFDLYFPATPTKPEIERKGTTGPWTRGRGETILFVDDEAAVREVARQALAEYGYRVLLAASGAEAVQVFQDFGKEIHLVITDMMMPETDGLTLVRTLRAMDPDIPILGATGVADAGALNRLKALDLKVVLPKPFTIGELLTAVQATLADAPPALVQP